MKLYHIKIDSEDSFESQRLGGVKAGFPSLAEDIREKLDLIKLQVKHKASTFFFRVSGVSMVGTALDEGNIIIVDRAVDPYNNCKAYATLMEGTPSSMLRWVIIWFVLCQSMNSIPHTSR